MVKIRCQDCGRTADVADGWDTYVSCGGCGGSFAELDSDEDTYEEDKEEEDKLEVCVICGKELHEGEYIHWDTNELSVDLNNYLDICKICLNKKYPMEKEIVYRDKIVEKPVIKYIGQDSQEKTLSNNFEGKTKFD